MFLFFVLELFHYVCVAVLARLPTFYQLTHHFLINILLLMLVYIKHLRVFKLLCFIWFGI